MILKIMVTKYDNNKKEFTEERYFDGFDNVNVEHISYPDEQCGYSCLVTNFVDSEVKYAVKIMLIKEDRLLRVIYIDNRFSVYLLNNEGKTIERIN